MAKKISKTPKIPQSQKAELPAGKISSTSPKAKAKVSKPVDVSAPSPMELLSKPKPKATTTKPSVAPEVKPKAFKSKILPTQKPKAIETPPSPKSGSELRDMIKSKSTVLPKAPTSRVKSGSELRDMIKSKKTVVPKASPEAKPKSKEDMRNIIKAKKIVIPKEPKPTSTKVSEPHAMTGTTSTAAAHNAGLLFGKLLSKVFKGAKYTKDLGSDIAGASKSGYRTFSKLRAKRT